jgi:hypothetical protein
VSGEFLPNLLRYTEVSERRVEAVSQRVKGQTRQGSFAT